MNKLRNYIIGFVLSIALTIVAFVLTDYFVLSNYTMFSQATMISMLVGLAVVQLLVQLFFFLHLDEESKPRWNSLVLAFAAFVIVVVVGGSIWIMYHLSHEMMGGEAMFEEEAIQPEMLHVHE